jgi:hypothetical protein
MKAIRTRLRVDSAPDGPDAEATSARGWPDFRKMPPPTRVSKHFENGRLPSITDPEYAEAAAGASSDVRLRIPRRAALNDVLSELESFFGADGAGDAELVRLEWRSQRRVVVVELVETGWRSRVVSPGRGRTRSTPAPRRAHGVFIAYQFVAAELRRRWRVLASRGPRQLAFDVSKAGRSCVVVSDDRDLVLRRGRSEQPVWLTRRGDLRVVANGRPGLYDLTIALTAAHFGVSPGAIRALGFTLIEPFKK